MSETPTPASPRYSTISIARKFAAIGVVSAYLVHIDDKYVGEVRIGRTATFSVAPGAHNVQIWNSLSSDSSDIILVQLEPEETCQLECKPNTQLFTSMFVGGPIQRFRAQREALKEQLMPPPAIILERREKPGKQA